MNGPLFISTYKRNFKLFGVFSLLIMMYLLITIGMFTSGGSDVFEMLPEGMRNAFGMQTGINNLTGFLASGYYGATYVIFLMIYCVIVSNQLIASLVERGSMASLLSTPVSRKRLVFTQASVLVVNLFATALLAVIAGLVMSPVLKGEQLDVSAFVQINLVGFLLFFVVSGYSYFFSCLMNDGKKALAASGLLSVLFYGVHIISNMSGSLDWMRNLTILTAFQPSRIVAGSYNVLSVSLMLAATGIVLYGMGIWIFSKRDLPL